MRTKMIWVSVLCCAYLVLSGPMAKADCAGGCCRPSVATSSVIWEWRPHAGDPQYLGLFRNGIQVGGYNSRTKMFRAYDAVTGQWGPPQSLAPKHDPCYCSPGCECEDDCRCSAKGPCVKGCPCVSRSKATKQETPIQKVEQEIPNYGVDLSKLNGKHEVVTLNGKPISKEKMYDLLAGGQLNDDSDKLRLTVIGTDPAQKQVLEDLSRVPLNEWKDQLLVQSYSPSHWAVVRSGFYSGGQPTIYVQAPDGEVLHRQDDYQDGPEGLATAIRRADPNYDSKKDPDLRKTLRFPNALTKIPLAVWLLTAGVLFGLFSKGKS